ncbi:MAG: hypothetical protein M0R74_06625 [Dehalococcoidia bacterium]|nr:hypothetical protein [Dehalococcoidia bacterium]
MRVEVIEFELTCPKHGKDLMVVPVQFPRPRGCRHCFAPLTERRELRRYFMESVPDNVGSEAWIG